MTVTETSFGHWMKQRRKALDLTQDELARRVGCSTMMIYKVEAGERRPSRQIAELLADRLEVALEEREHFVRFARTLPGEAAPELPANPAAAQRAPSSMLGVGHASELALTPLPGVATPLLGREAELAELAGLLANPSCRLLTIVGPGGIGKTRLAIEAAARYASSRQPTGAGVGFVALASVASPALLAPAIANALGLAPSAAADPLAHLREALHEQELLLLLDNLEQLTEAAPALAELLQGAPGVRMLVTSRERLNLSAEWVFELHGLTLPNDDRASSASAAVELFVHAARRADASFVLTPAEAPHVARICTLVAGMPLGIELAASWVRVLSCAEIAQELERSADFLAAAARDTPQRHRSLRAVFDHSWQLLDGMQRRALSHLSVFRGGFTLAAAQAILSEGEALPQSQVLAALAALADKSLLRHSGRRYELHEIVRQYAAEQLALLPAAREQAEARHTRFYAAILAEREVALKGAGQQSAARELTADIDNLRLAWQRAIEATDVEAIGRMAPGLSWLYEVRCWLPEGASAFERAVLALGSAHAAQRGQALAQQAWFSFRLGQAAHARALLDEALPLLRAAGNPQALADALRIAGTLTQLMGDYVAGRALLDECLALAQSLGDRWTSAFVLSQLGLIAHSQGEYAEARRMLADSVDIARALGDLRGAAFALSALGSATHALGGAWEAQQQLRESLALSSAIGNFWGVATAFNHLGLLAYDLGQFSEARYLFEESLATFRRIGERWSIARMLVNLGYTHHAIGERSAARRSFERALRLAMDARALPVVLDAMSGLATLLACEGDCQGARELAAQVISHPASSRLARRRVMAIVDGCDEGTLKPAHSLEMSVAALL
jgi:predicted ATPase/DNA-binding XRE family transcriptional regulator